LPSSPAKFASLATKSGASAAQINEILGTMVEKIRNFQAQDSRSPRGSRPSYGENRTIEFGDGGSLPRAGGSSPGAGLSRKRSTSLSAPFALSRIQTGAHARERRGSGASLELLESITQSIVTASDEQKQCNEELKSNLAVAPHGFRGQSRCRYEPEKAHFR
jgi:hypothetical protein